MKPPNIPVGLEWFEKAANADNEDNEDNFAVVAACRGLALVYSSFYGHTDHYSLAKTLKYGRKALSIESECHTSHQAIAKAYAVDGQFEKAVEHQELAIKYLTEYGSTAAMEKTLELYRNNKAQ